MFVKGHSLQAQVSTLSVSLRCPLLAQVSQPGPFLRFGRCLCKSADGGAATLGPDTSQERSDRWPGAKVVGALAPGPAAAGGGAAEFPVASRSDSDMAAGKLSGGEARAPTLGGGHAGFERRPSGGPRAAPCAGWGRGGGDNQPLGWEA